MSTPSQPSDATRLMVAAAGGDRKAGDELLPLVFDQLRQAAQRQLAAERVDHTLSATALVHEAYLKLCGTRDVPWAGRGHYYAAAAEAMRRILVDHARKKTAKMRGGTAARRAAVRMSSLPDPASEAENGGFLILDAAIRGLKEVDAHAASVVQLRYFAGLSIEETAQALDVSTATVSRNWTFARGWLKEAIESERF